MCELGEKFSLVRVGFVASGGVPADTWSKFHVTEALFSRNVRHHQDDYAHKYFLGLRRQ